MKINEDQIEIGAQTANILIKEYQSQQDPQPLDLATWPDPGRSLLGVKGNVCSSYLQTLSPIPYLAINTTFSRAQEDEDQM